MVSEIKKPESSIKKEILPTVELITKDGYRWFTFDSEQTGLKLLCMEDLETGVVLSSIFANPDKRTAAHVAWAGARHSRSPGEPWEIMFQMGEKGVDPDQKLEEMFRKYGHASVGDMARLNLQITRTPMHFCLTLLNEGMINSAQEKSTRYQKGLGKTNLHPIENYLPDGLTEEDVRFLQDGYERLGEKALGFFNKYAVKVKEAYMIFYKPETKDEEDSLDSRVLDTNRFFVLLGQSTGMTFETSARDWSRIISEMKASPIKFNRRMAANIERFFTPTKEEEEKLGVKAEAPGLIRHTEAATQTNKNLEVLGEYLQEAGFLEKVDINFKFKGKVKQGVDLLPDKYTEAERMVAEYVMTIWPGAELVQTLDWLHSIPDEKKREISGIVLNGHNHKEELTQMGRVSRNTLVLSCFMGELRDMNRQRGYGRFIDMPLISGKEIDFATIAQIMAQGYGLPLYLEEMEEFKDLANDFERDLESYYEELYRFVGSVNDRFKDRIDYSFVLNLLPMAHHSYLLMNGDPKQDVYMPSLRKRPGGHINYRVHAWEAAKLESEKDPYMSALPVGDRPDPRNREEFFDRS